MSENSQMPLRRVCWVVLSGLIVLAYSNTMRAPFVYDDKIEVIGNTTIRFIDQWQSIVLYNPSRWLLQLSYAANYHQGQLDPFIYHFTNVAIHILAAGAAFAAVEQLARLAKHDAPTRLAAWVAAFWALHPMLTESVTYTTGRSESLCGLFAFSAIGLWAKHLRNQKWWSAGIVYVLTLAAIFTKEVGLVIPLVLVLMNAFLAPGQKWRTLIPLVALLVLGFLGRFLSVTNEYPSLGAALLDANLGNKLMPKEVDRSLSVQLSTQAEVWLRYVLMWIAPVGQTIFHQVPERGPLELRGFLSIIGWIAFIGSSWVLTRKRPLARFAIFTACITLLPSSSVVSLKESMAEHRAHQFGLFFVLAIFSKASPSWRWFVVLLPLCGLTHWRNQVWQSEVSIWQEATERHPNSAKAWYGLGDAHRFSSQLESAIGAYGKCLEVDSKDHDCWNNLGITYAELGRGEQAINAWSSVLIYDPKYCKAHTNIGQIAFLQRQFEKSRGSFESSISHCPDNIIAHYGLGNLYYGPLRNAKKAAVHYQAVLELNPNFEHAADAREKLLDLTW